MIKQIPYTYSVGFNAGKYEVFRHTSTPTEEQYPQYKAVIGPFKTKRGAKYLVDNYWCGCVQDAEKLSKHKVLAELEQI